MLSSWDDARLFLAVAETGSFSAAARALDVGQATVSRRVSELETALGVALFRRGRRGTRLTRPGERLVEPAKQMARWATELERAMVHDESQAGGTVRLTAPPGFMYDFMVPFCGWFRGRHPGIRVELLAGVDFLDLGRGDADVALRNRAPTDPALVEVTRLTVSAGAFVAAELADELPPNPTPAEVPWICWAGRHERVQPRAELEALIPGFEPAFASDDYLVQLRACEEGLGALFLPRVKHPLLDDRGLVEIALDVPPVEDTLYLVCARSMRHVARVRVLLEALTDQLDRVRHG